MTEKNSMPDDFQQTVDLREKIERRRQSARPVAQPAPKKIVAPLEKIYQDQAAGERKEDLRKISQPQIGRPSRGLVSRIVFVLAIVMISAAVYFLFFRQKTADPRPLASGWYAVKLVDGEIFYGQIADLKADPVAIANVYYNYDQAKQTDNSKDRIKTIEETGPPGGEAGNIRLVKRGKETHGPDGSINLVRAQVLFMEPLKADSKVLQAILQYEK